MNLKIKIIFISLSILLFSSIDGAAQDGKTPSKAKYKEPTTLLWINTYGNIRIANRFFWIAQTHFRFRESKNIPFAGQIAQLYNRHAVSYLFSKQFNVSLGGVLRVNFNPNENRVGSNEKRTVPEWRIWHQYQFAMPFPRMMIYHRLRIEHRWTKDYEENSAYFFRNRYRYMLKFKVPINKPKLGPRTFYISPETELIMQSGERVVNSPMEDLRIHASLGYIINSRLTVALGLMYSQGQDLNDGSIYGQKWTPRFHLYFSPDIRRVKNKIPEIHTTD